MINNILKSPIKVARHLKQKIHEQRLVKNVTGKPIVIDTYEKIFTMQKKDIKDLNIACIMDPFTYGSYSWEANFKQLTPQKWKNEITSFSPDMLFIESAWRGKDELWWNSVAKKCSELVDIVNHCKENNIPTVFWNKEDPIHFHTFLDTASLFDFVFTTDIDMIGKYIIFLQHNRVYPLPFACQPKINNPIETYPRKDAFCFAGAYYVRYPERTKDLDEFIQYLPEIKPIKIYDRNYGKDDPNYMFPDAYKEFIVGTLPFEEIDKAYKGYNYAINLNSVKQSQSMFARRVYEVLASNTITVSNFSRAVRLLFGDLVITSDDGTQIVKRVEELNSNEEHMRKHKLKALRKVLSEHTYAKRLAYVVEKVFGHTRNDALPNIAVVCQVNSTSDYQKIVSIFNTQTYTHKTLNLVVSDETYLKKESNNTDIQYISKSKSDLIGTTFKNSDFIAGIDLDDQYGENYLTDLALATLYFDGPVIGKATYYKKLDNDSISLFNNSSQYTLVNQVYSKMAIIKKELISSSIVTDWVCSLKNSIVKEVNALSIDEFNYCQNGYDLSSEVSERFLDAKNIKTGMYFDDIVSKIENTSQDKIISKPDLSSLPIIIGKEKHLVLTNIYPSYDNLYRNSFVHARVKAYKEQDIDVDVLQMQNDKPLSYDEFEDVNVTIGSKEALYNLLKNNNYKSILVHFLNEDMWSVLTDFIPDIKVNIWVHGFEIQPWYRREHLFETRRALKKAKVQSHARLLFWKDLLKKPHRNLKLVFVSQYLANSVMEDLELNIPKDNYQVIHNFINTDFFNYSPKDSIQRKKILSIRPYANKNYANDLSVQAILELSKKSYFNELEFRLIGDGVLFDKTLKPLKKFENVIIEKKFLTQKEIANLHKEYGIFLCPSRMDTHGVSRDEAMSSGLVPVTNHIAAIPEFVDGSCGILAKEEDTHGLAEGIEKLYKNPSLFQKMSNSAAKRVRIQCNFDQTIGQELKIFSTKTIHDKEKEL